MTVNGANMPRSNRTNNKPTFQFSIYGCVAKEDKPCQSPSNVDEYHKAIQERLDYLRTRGYSIQKLEFEIPETVQVRQMVWRKEFIKNKIFYLIPGQENLHELLSRADEAVNSLPTIDPETQIDIEKLLKTTNG